MADWWDERSVRLYRVSRWFVDVAPDIIITIEGNFIYFIALKIINSLFLTFRAYLYDSCGHTCKHFFQYLFADRDRLKCYENISLSSYTNIIRTYVLVCRLPINIKCEIFFPPYVLRTVYMIMCVLYKWCTFTYYVHTTYILYITILHQATFKTKVAKYLHQ